MCVFNIKQLNSMFRWADQIFFMCLCIFVLKDESTLFAFWHVICAWSHSVWPSNIILRFSKCGDLFSFLFEKLKIHAYFIPQIDIYIYNKGNPLPTHLPKTIVSIYRNPIMMENIKKTYLHNTNQNQCQYASMEL